MVGGRLKVTVAAGTTKTINISIDHVKGDGDNTTVKKGDGTFQGETLPDTLSGGGSWTLTITPAVGTGNAKAVLTFFDLNGNEVHSWTSRSGTQNGIDGKWSGEWAGATLKAVSAEAEVAEE